jgi:riboflavin kinase
MRLVKTVPIEALIQLAKEGAHRGSVRISLNWLADRSGISRQTAARRLAELEGQGSIERTMEPRGQNVRITPTGLAVLRAFHQELGSILKSVPHSVKLSGRVVTGIGEGGYYMNQTQYIKEFEKGAGFVPYSGTLDIKLEKDSVGSKEMIARLPSKEVPGFETKERAFGPVKFFPARLRKSRVAIILPLRSHYTDILEIIAPQNLRKVLGLKDGDLVQVEVIV